MAQLQTEMQKTVAEQTVTKIHGQPTNIDIDLLEEELIPIAATVATALGGGNNGHAELLLDDVKYGALAPGTPFIQPSNPGIYPDGVTNANRARLEAEHKEQVRWLKHTLALRRG